jgi:hypothetical protein
VACVRGFDCQSFVDWGVLGQFDAEPDIQARGSAIINGPPSFDGGEFSVGLD